MGENNEGRPSFSSLNTPIIRHRPSSAASCCTMDSPDHPSGISTPPLQTSASVPFKWEQEPGKPRPQTTTRTEPADKCQLDPPPCRMMQFNTKTPPSPSSIMDGPYSVGRPRFFSFRFFKEGGQESSSFETCTPPPPRRRDQPGTPNYNVDALLGSKKSSTSTKGRGFFGKLKGTGNTNNREVDGGSFGFSSSSTSTSSCDSDEMRCSRRRMENNINGGGRKLRRQASFPTVPLAHAHAHARSSHIWATIYEGLKHVIQWKSSRKVST